MINGFIDAYDYLSGLPADKSHADDPRSADRVEMCQIWVALCDGGLTRRHAGLLSGSFQARSAAAVLEGMPACRHLNAARFS
jgi:hypothetical protein